MNSQSVRPENTMRTHVNSLLWSQIKNRSIGQLTNLFHVDILQITDVNVFLVALGLRLVLGRRIVFQAAIIHARCWLNARVAVVTTR